MGRQVNWCGNNLVVNRPVNVNNVGTTWNRAARVEQRQEREARRNERQAGRGERRAERQAGRGERQAERREWDGPAALPPPTALRVRGGLSGEGAPPCLARPPFTQ